MRQRRFGDTGLHASEIAFGTWALGSDWWGKTDDPDRLIGRALELGITFFDTGDAYGQGVNEEIVGRALARADRDSIQISTKFGYVLDSDRQQHSEGERPQDWSPEHVREALEGSLRRLGTDHVDLYQLHNPRMDALERDDLWETLEDLRQEGSLRHYGVALGPKIGWRDEGLRAIDERPIASLQTVFNLLEQEPGVQFLEVASRRRVGVIARVPTSSGLLEGHLTPASSFTGNDHRRHRPREWLVDGLRKVDQLEFLRRDGRRTLAQAAMRFIIQQPRMACVIPTITSMAELEEFAGAADAPELTDDELARVDELYRSGFGLAAGAAAG
jgi:aryl-alcohol dehydrogenase-like predicted oxidoreductase